MRLANLDGRAVIVTDHGPVDIAAASNGRFPSTTDLVIPQLEAVRLWLDAVEPAVTSSMTPDELSNNPRLGPVVERPSQIFAVGLNYRMHALEMNMTPPTKPMVFTKFGSSLAGATATFPVPSPRTDWESELVIIFAKRGRNVDRSDALSYVGGYCVGQDLSDRDLQMHGASAQFSLGKSYENFSPIGPWLTTADEVADPNALRIMCDVNGLRYQDSTTGDMVFDVAELISYVSTVCEIRAGDVMFTGSPHGVGQGQSPPVFLSPGDLVVTTIEGLGTLRNEARAF